MGDTTTTPCNHDAFYQVECPDCKEKDTQLADVNARIAELESMLTLWRESEDADPDDDLCRRMDAYLAGHTPLINATWNDLTTARAEAAAERERAEKAERATSEALSMAEQWHFCATHTVDDEGNVTGRWVGTTLSHYAATHPADPETGEEKS